MPTRMPRSREKATTAFAHWLVMRWLAATNACERWIGTSASITLLVHGLNVWPVLWAWRRVLREDPKEMA